MLSLVTISPVITAFHSCCLSHGAHGTADRGVESLRFQVSIVRRQWFQILPKPARGLLCQKCSAIDNYELSFEALRLKRLGAISLYNFFFFFFFVLHPTTGQVQHKAFFKVGPDAGPQPTRVWQDPKIPLAQSVPPKMPGNKNSK